MAMEIERKFLLLEYPTRLISEGELKILSEKKIDQTYLAMDENQELRVRRLQDLESDEVEYTHTFKMGNGLSREEIEYAISECIYEQITNAFRAVPLTKKRVTAEWGDIIVEIDCYDQIDMLVLEVEFDSEEAANDFVAPDWFGRDISSDRQYSNKKVWRELQAKS
ncbi:adenylate cyclase [Paenibacillus baekrokdamisoli]|uniref:Adenylate cyclase n=1 Tax=Paenibacillus baekrokdamisoli TaxID=1712516 RepID=A0A3G9ITT8_9BACL|nr:CYTH domain-containing protein [Paenibacillus baekrokdamisoli]MBB3070771.1 CYTH domain-containing protein [Paenibacillus baekrokdamisoli]BBH22287.1 adenylate cyclase [Paenibacillus baekrokdamisoli]